MSSYPPWPVTRRQHQHWAESSAGSWMRTMVVTFAAGVALKGKAAGKLIMFSAVLTGAANAYVYLRRHMLTTFKGSQSYEARVQQFAEEESLAAKITMAVTFCTVVLFACAAAAHNS